MPSYNVFLSSTFADFADERERLSEVLSCIQVNCIRAEDAGNAGIPLSKMLINLIDQCEMVVLLLGSRAGTPSNTGEPWTQKEVKYALEKKKRIFAYIREVPQHYKDLVDVNSDRQASLEEFKKFIESEIGMVPRYQLGECCRLAAMVIRDVDRYAEGLRGNQQENDKFAGFL